MKKSITDTTVNGAKDGVMTRQNCSLVNPSVIANDGYRQTIIDYYSEVGIDYEPWSANLNMHFGYFRWGINPLDRESLLNEMNAQVCARLQLDPDTDSRVVDLGCGVGATSRYCAMHYKRTSVLGVTIVPWQVERAHEMTEEVLRERVDYVLNDYCDTGYAPNSFDGAYAMESSCYDKGLNKLGFLKEAFRLLKPGAKLVVTDGFRKTDKAYPLFEKAYQQVCEGWSLDTFANIHQFASTLQELGFKNITIEDISWRLAPSVMHVPWVSMKYLLTRILLAKGDKVFQKRHFMAPMMGLFVGLHRKHYGYYIVTAEK